MNTRKARSSILITLFLVIALSPYIVFRRAPENTSDTSPKIPIGIDSQKPQERIEVVTRDLEVPWALAFLPDSSILVTERAGRLKLISPDGGVKSGVEIAEVKEIGEGGLLGVAVDPNFSENNFIFLYFTYGEENGNTMNRVVRYKFEGQGLKDPNVLIDKIPGATFHNGGRIKFGPDGFLYITTGDAQNPSSAQSLDSLAGKVLRVNSDAGLSQNSSFDDLIYSYGHRNPQGLTWDEKGNLWSTEHGQSATDEVNKIEKGKNYGWPIIKGEEKKSGMVSPFLQSGDETWAPAGVAYYKGSIYFGGLRGQALYQVILESDPKLLVYFKNELGRIRDVVLGPDGILYITTTNRDGRGKPNSGDDKIIKINPEKP